MQVIFDCEIQRATSSRESPNDIVPIKDLYVISLSIRSLHLGSNGLGDPATLVDVQLTVRASERRNV
jgi:hypothetical protein